MAAKSVDGGELVGEPVTVTIARRIAPGREPDFEAWSERLTKAAMPYPGYLGAGLLRPSHVGEPWHVVFRFDSAAHLSDWEDSPERVAILASGGELVRSTHVHRVSGLETWFALPGRTAPAPPRWKMFLVTLCAIFSLQTVLNLAITPLGLPFPLHLAAMAISVTALMTWLVMPALATLLQGWLYAPPRRA